jgi:hypothetical protein
MQPISLLDHGILTTAGRAGTAIDAVVSVMLLRLKKF